MQLFFILKLIILKQINIINCLYNFFHFLALMLKQCYLFHLLNRREAREPLAKRLHQQNYFEILIIPRPLPSSSMPFKVYVSKN